MRSIGGGFGRILYVSSIAAITGGVIGPHYAASKAALHGLMHHMATRLAPSRLTVNVIAPALIATPMSRRAQDDPAILAYLAEKQPLAGGPIDADAVTATALHLLSPDAAMVTGQVVAVDGGWGVSEAGSGHGPVEGGRPAF